MIEIRYPFIKERIEIKPKGVNTLVIEHPNMLYEFVSSLISTLCKENSKLFFVKDSEEMTNFKSIFFINNMFDIDINNKRFLTILHKEIIKDLQTNMHELNSCYQQIYSIINNITDTFLSPITINEAVDYVNLIKLFNPTIISESDKLFDKIIDFVDVAIEFSELELLILLNVEDYLTKEEVTELIKVCNYKEVMLLFIQGRRNYELEKKKCLIINKDLCEIIVKQ